MTNLDRLTNALAGRYTIERELGSGGMATVYLAEDLKHHRKVGIKVLRPELSEAIGPERFVREIEIAAGLHHPHILPLYDSGEADGFLYYVMPFVDGESLRDRIDRDGALPIAVTIRLLREVADALAKAHAANVVHRDIKPDNVMLADGHALVADFGVAKAVSDASGSHQVTTAGLALGTPAYMSPEQAAADPHIDHRADLYAFGVMAYEMLSGDPPFTGTTPQQVIAAHVTHEPAPVTRHRAEVPPDLATVVMRCLAKSPDDRWQTAVEIVSRLDAVATPVDGTPVRSGQGPPGTAASFVTKVAAALVGLALAAGSWFALTNRDNAADPDLIAVLPFRVSAQDLELDDLREGMVDLMATFFTGEAGTPRAVHPGTLLNAWREEIPSNDQDLAEANAVELARSLGAGRLLTGSIVGTGGRIAINGTMTDVTGTASLRATVEGSPDSLFQLLPGFVGQLLAQDAGIDVIRSQTLTASLPALRAYLRGTALDREGNFWSAVDRFAEALESDPEFALAGVGLLSANGWSARADSATVAGARRAAWNHRDRLTARDRALVAAVMGPRGFEPSPRRELLAAREQATRIAPDRPEAWYFLGDTYFHDGMLLGIENAMERADAAFARLLALDSLDAGILQHRLLIAGYLGDTTEVRRLAGLARLADTTGWLGTGWYAGVILGDVVMRDGAVSSLATMSQRDLILAALSAPVPALMGKVDELETLIREVERHITYEPLRGVTTLTRGFVALDAGRPAEAAALMRELGDSYASSKVLANLFWGGDSVLAEEAADVLANDPDLVVPMVAGVPNLPNGISSNACVLALWNLARSETDELPDLLRRLRANGERTGTGTDSVTAIPNGLCADVVEAGWAVASNAPDARERVDAVDRLLLQQPHRILSWQNLYVAQLLETQGEHARAAAAARRHYLLLGYNTFYSSQLREAGRLSELAGQPDRAIDAYTRYLDLRRNPEVSVQPEVDEVRAALSRLTGERRPN